MKSEIPTAMYLSDFCVDHEYADHFNDLNKGAIKDSLDIAMFLTTQCDYMGIYESNLEFSELNNLGTSCGNGKEDFDNSDEDLAMSGYFSVFDGSIGLYHFFSY